MDTTNFGDIRIEEYFKDAVEFVFELFVETLDDDDESVLDGNEGETEVIVEYCNGDGMETNDQDLELYNLVRRKSESEVVVVNKKRKVINKQNVLRRKIAAMMVTYKDECKKIKMASYLEENGNDLYKSMVAKKTIDRKKIQAKDPLYVSKFFDAAKWWMKHEIQFPELAMGASIMLGKPSHNAFQERVFSRGTYSDTKLRKRLKEEHFEMSVMNAVNNKLIDDIFHIMQPAIMRKERDRQQEMKLFLEKRKNELDFSEVTEKDVDFDEDGNVIEPEYGSVCSDELFPDADEDRKSVV